MGNLELYEIATGVSTLSPQAQSFVRGYIEGIRWKDSVLKSAATEEKLAPPARDEKRRRAPAKRETAKS